MEGNDGSKSLDGRRKKRETGRLGRGKRDGFNSKGNSYFALNPRHKAALPKHSSLFLFIFIGLIF